MPSPYQLLRDGGWNFPNRSKEESIPELFIIESMDGDDEESGFFEGVRIAQILRLGLFKPKYFYVQDERELELLVPVFRQSSYRYLHMSCHGDQEGFILRDGNVSFARFAEIFGDSLKLCRLFVSACESGQKALVQELHKTAHGIHSVVAPRVKIDYDHAAAIWSAFYVSLLQKRSGDCKHVDVIKALALLCRLIPMANIKDKILMSFMMAGYSPTTERDYPKRFPWKFQNVNRAFDLGSLKPNKA